MRHGWGYKMRRRGFVFIVIGAGAWSVHSFACMLGRLIGSYSGDTCANVAEASGGCNG